MDRPGLGVPSDESIQLSINSGSFNSTCENTAAGGVNPILLFDFNTLEGAAELVLVGDDPWGVSLNVTSFNLDEVNLQLTAPPLPVPNNVLDDVMKQGLNNLIPTINDWFTNHPLYLPDDVQFWIPNPELRVFAQECDDCYPPHGYLEVATFCSCEDDDKTWPSCSENVELCPERAAALSSPVVFSAEVNSAGTYFQPPPPLASPRLPYKFLPPPSPSSSPLSSSNTSEIIHVIQFDADSPSSCSLALPTESAVVYPIAAETDPSVDAACVWMLGGEVPDAPQLPPLFAAARLHPDDFSVVTSLWLFCNSNCTKCQISETQNVATSKCISSTTDTVYLVLPPQNSTHPSVCNDGLLVDDDMLYLDQSSESDCDSSYAHSITNVGVLDGCTDGSSSAVTTEIGSIEVFYNCNSTCSNSECDVDASFFGVSSSCTQFHSQSTNDTVGGRLVNSSYMNACLVPPTPAPSPSPPAPDYTKIGAIASITLAPLFVVGFLAGTQKGRDATRTLAKFLAKTALGFFAVLSSFLFDSLTQLMYFAGWKKITARYVNRDAAQSNLPSFPAPILRWLNVFFWKEEIPTSIMCNHERCLYAMIVALLLAVLKVVCWYLFDPYAYFDEGHFAEIGLTPDLFDVSKAAEIFSTWQAWGLYSQVATMTLIVLVALKWDSPRIIAAALQFSVVVEILFTYVIPPLMYSTTGAIELLESDDNDVQGNQDARDTISTVASYGLTGVSLSYMSYLYLFMVQSISVPTYLTWILHLPNRKTDTQKERNTHVEWLCCMCSLAWIMQVIVVASAIVPVVITYQSLGIGREYIIYWLLLFILPLLSVFHAHSLSARLKRREDYEAFEEGRRWNFGLLLFFFALLMGLVFRGLIGAIAMDVDVNKFTGIQFGLNSFMCSLVAYVTTVAQFAEEEGEEEEVDQNTENDTSTERSQFLANMANIRVDGTDNTRSSYQQQQEQHYEQLAAELERELTGPKLSLAVACFADPSHFHLTISQSTVAVINTILATGTFCLLITMWICGVFIDKIYCLTAFGNTTVFIFSTFFWHSFRVPGQHLTEQSTAVITDGWITKILGWLIVAVIVTTLVVMIGYSDNEDFKPFIIVIICCITVPAALYMLWSCGGGFRRVLGDILMNSIGFVLETQIKEGEFIGHRVPKRRLFLIVGTASFIVHTIYELHETSVDESAAKRFNDLMLLGGYNLTWPEGEPTIFDDAFELYDDSALNALYVEVLAAIALFGAMLCDVSNETTHGLKWSRLMLSCTMVLLLISTFATSFPNYLDNTDIDSICPTCAPQFDYMLLTMSGNIVGVGCAGILSFSVFSMLVTVPPALLRSVALTAEMKVEAAEEAEMEVGTEKNKNNGRGKDGMIRERCAPLTLVFAMGTFGMPIISCPMFVVLQQVVGDWITLLLIGISWGASVMIGVVLFVKNPKVHQLKYFYLLWLLFYYNTLAIMLSRVVADYDLTSNVFDQLQKWDFYCMFMVDYCLANVMLGDILCVLLDDEREEGEGEEVVTSMTNRGGGGASFAGGLARKSGGGGGDSLRQSLI
jgi:hypothetical protein